MKIRDCHTSVNLQLSDATSTLISTRFLQDKTISLELRGFLASLASHPPGFEFSIPWAMEHFGCSRRDIVRLLKEAVASRYEIACLRAFYVR